MTQALCLHCGEIKRGALTQCRACGSGPTGNENLDIEFSDHLIAVESLRQFGRVIQALRKTGRPDDVCFWAFITFVAERHPSILSASAPPELQDPVRATLNDASLLDVQVLPGNRIRSSRPESDPAKIRRTASWFESRPVVGQTRAAHHWRSAVYAFSWFCAIALLTVGYGLYLGPNLGAGEWDWIHAILMLGLPLFAAAVALKTIEFLIRAAKARYIGPNPVFTDSPGQDA